MRFLLRLSPTNISRIDSMHSRFFFIPIGHALKIFGFSSLLIMPSLTAAAGTEAAKLAEQYACTACHGADRSVVGPAFRDIAKKYAGNKNAAAELVAKVRVGGSGVWGQVPMPPNAHVPEADVQKIVAWVLAGAPAE